MSRLPCLGIREVKPRSRMDCSQIELSVSGLLLSDICSAVLGSVGNVRYFQVCTRYGHKKIGVNKRRRMPVPICL
jgi:hypothetical protein